MNASYRLLFKIVFIGLAVGLLLAKCAGPDKMTTYYEEVECKEKAKLISGYGYFNVCSESETAIIPAGAVFNYVVYDSNDIEAIPYCESDRPTKILEEHFSRHMQQHVTRVKKMSGNFYQLSYSTDFEDGSLCYKSR